MPSFLAYLLNISLRRIGIYLTVIYLSVRWEFLSLLVVRFVLMRVYPASNQILKVQHVTILLINPRLLPIEKVEVARDRVCL